VVEMLCCPVITNSVCFSLQVYLRDWICVLCVVK
jgi:hypothetical protein